MDPLIIPKAMSRVGRAKLADKPFPKATGPWYEVGAKSVDIGATVTDIWVYDVIGDDWWDPSLTAKELCQTIVGITTDEIVLHMSSPGGCVSDAIAIFNALRQHPAKVSAIIEGHTASAATYLTQAADPGCITMYDNTLFMIHKPWTYVFEAGNEDYLEQVMTEVVAYLRKCTSTLLGGYMARCTKTDAELMDALAATKYLDADEALEWGFVDTIKPALEAAACAHVGSTPFAAMGFAPIPVRLEALAAEAEPHNTGSTPTPVAADTPRIVGHVVATQLTSSQLRGRS